MLARRVVTRPAASIRRLGGSQLQRRFISLSGSPLQALPRPNTWLAKLRFRPDGNPRSKLIALGFGSCILSSLLFTFILFAAIAEVNETENILVKMMLVQQTDIAYYDSVDFDDPKATLSYFKKLYLSFTWDVESAKQLFDAMMTVVNNRKIEGLSKMDAEAQVHQIMRSAAEKIHGAIRDLGDDSESIVEAAKVVSLVKDVALNSIVDLMFKDETIRDYTVQIRDSDQKIQNKMDAGISKEYEVLE